ncbi:MAG: DsrE family protein [Burkholderiaceae bacterium]|nr:DsrE family protein [Burkholderiaceae bacterium]
MANYLLIESRDHFAREGFCGALARTLARDGAQVAVLLVQNGVLAAREGAHADTLADMARAGVVLYADEFSLRERGIAADALSHAVRPAPLDIVIDRMADGWRVVWH